MQAFWLILGDLLPKPVFMIKSKNVKNVKFDHYVCTTYSRVFTRIIYQILLLFCWVKVLC